MVSRFLVVLGCVYLGLTAVAAIGHAGEDVIRSARVLAPDHLRLEFSRPVRDLTPANFRFTDARAPDVPIAVLEVRPQPGNQALLTLGRRLDPAGAYRIVIRDPAASRDVRPVPLVLMFSIVISAALINNFVFTRYLGLCVFFGVSRKRDTAIGMGITFGAVMLVSGMLSWALYTWILRPLHLGFLQVLIFIGVVAFLVQLLDTILKKTHRELHRKFGIYLMLITTNCIILAVPLLNASADSGPKEALSLSLASPPCARAPNPSPCR